MAALALYPRVRWEVVVELGRTLLPPEAVNFTNLLKLARISWMHEGSFPDYTRFELLKTLSPANEVKARETLLRMLQLAENYFPARSFSAEKNSCCKRPTSSRFLPTIPNDTPPTNRPSAHSSPSGSGANFPTRQCSGI